MSLSQGSKRVADESNYGRSLQKRQRNSIQNVTDKNANDVQDTVGTFTCINTLFTESAIYCVQSMVGGCGLVILSYALPKINSKLLTMTCMVLDT